MTWTTFSAPTLPKPIPDSRTDIAEYRIHRKQVFGGLTRGYYIVA